MANLFVKHTGSNTAPYDTWAKAATTLATACSAAAAGDNVYVSNNHSESAATGITIAGTVGAHKKVICVDDSGSPGAATTGAQVSGTGQINLTASYSYVYGIKFTAATHFYWDTAAATQEAVYENCTFVTTHSGGVLFALGNSSGNRPQFFRFKDCKFKFGGTGQRLNLVAFAEVFIEGGSLDAGSAAVTSFVNWSYQSSSNVAISGFDLSGAATAVYLFEDSGAAGKAVARDLKMPASWSGSVFSGTPSACMRLELHNSDNSGTNYRTEIADVWGRQTHETTLVRTGGASDGTTGLSWKLVSTANTNYPGGVFRSGEAVVWNDATGSSKTVAVEILHDSATNLKNDEVWLEVMYLGTSGAPLGSWIADNVAGDNSGNLLATAADQTTSSATWTTTGMSNPNKQKLSVTFTPQVKGFIHARVALAKASKTIYVDPVLTVS